MVESKFKYFSKIIDWIEIGIIDWSLKVNWGLKLEDCRVFITII